LLLLYCTRLPKTVSKPFETKNNYLYITIFYNMNILNMKKLFSALLLVMLVGVGFAQVSTDQNTVITKVSADWCPNCGGWAWPVFEDMRSAMADKNAIFVLAHRDGGLKNDVSFD